MLAFRNCVHTKESAVALAQMHYDADNFEKGHYEFKNGKACSVGCMVGEYIAKNGGNWHKAEKTLFGIYDLRLSYLQDRIFEGLPLERSKIWTLEFFNAIPDGADLSKVADHLMYWLLTDPGGLPSSSKTEITGPAIKAVADLYKRRLEGDDPLCKEWNKAAWAAWAAGAAWAAWAARAAGDAWAMEAARAAEAAGAAWAAWAAWAAGDARAAGDAGDAGAAWAVEAARAAEAEFFILLANKLLEFLKNAPVPA